MIVWRAIAIIVVLVAGAPVHADDVPPRQWREGPPLTTSLAIGGGGCDPSAYVADVRAMVGLASPAETGVMLGLTAGLEYWRGRGGGGGGIPVALVFGGQLRPLIASLGVGANLVIVDRIAGVTGTGVLAPYASASIGLHVAEVTVALDGAVTRRWHVDADDLTQWTLVVMVGWMREALRR